MNTEAFLKTAIGHIRAGRNAEAQNILEPLLETEPGNLPAWFWYVETWPTLPRRIQALQLCLQHNPDSEKAQYALRTLTAQRTSLVRSTPRVTTATIIDAKPYYSARPSPPAKKAGLSRNARLAIYLAGGLLGFACLGGAGLAAIMFWQNLTGSAVALLPTSTSAAPVSTEPAVVAAAAHVPAAAPILATPVPTSTPAPTNTPAPTETPQPTDTPPFTDTPKATNTPRSTSTPRPTATLQYGTLNSPFAFHQEASLYNQSGGQRSDWTLLVEQVIRGDEANGIVVLANSFNDAPPAGTSYMLIKVRVTLVSGGAFTLNAQDLAVVSGGQLFAGIQFSTCCTESIGYPKLKASIALPGTTVEGWIIRPVLLNDEKPLLALNIDSYRPNLDNGLFFALYR